ncbi:3451_t:CDS:1 [Dentiscutata erythropus]|uniref:3451_t:CDS:1 n=1 Tax=Dentiscutata erythropus TaxID=1348616 RepID=A0A9N9JUT8_9GLOM|nr:3451_t:CDS:1 [Dentiscutata erythropus]
MVSTSSIKFEIFLLKTIFEKCINKFESKNNSNKLYLSIAIFNIFLGLILFVHITNFMIPKHINLKWIFGGGGLSFSFIGNTFPLLKKVFRTKFKVEYFDPNKILIDKSCETSSFINQVKKLRNELQEIIQSFKSLTNKYITPLFRGFALMFTPCCYLIVIIINSKKEFASLVIGINLLWVIFEGYLRQSSVKIPFEKPKFLRTIAGIPDDSAQAHVTVDIHDVSSSSNQYYVSFQQNESLNVEFENYTLSADILPQPIGPDNDPHTFKTTIIFVD